MAAIATEVTSLQKAALDKIVTGLGELASSIACRFCCGNTLSSPDQVNLVYEMNGTNWSSIMFPGAKQEDVQQLMSVCSVASFGVGSEEVTDKNYRDALQLQPNQFTTSFQLCDTPILGEVQKLMMPDMSERVRAKLHELDIYSGPGGHFKAHVDTPRSSQMFGSLVVCLPTQFSGGALVTRHQGKEVRFDWSSSPQNPMQRVSWAAFFSDVEHEILPVTDGYCLTLTYNLYCVDKVQAVTPTANITFSPFYHELRAAVSNPHFLRDGGVLGFSCQHDYVFQDLNCTDDLPYLLKGADNIVYMSAVSLGLPVIVKPVTSHLNPDEKPYRYVLPKFEKFFVHDFDVIPGEFDDEYDEDNLIEKTFGRLVHYDKNITWCQGLTKFQPVFAYLYYDDYSCNDVSCLAAYQAAAILMCVPKWVKRQTLCVDHQQSPSETFERRRKKRRSQKEEEEEEEEKEEEESGLNLWEKLAQEKQKETKAAIFGGRDMNKLLHCDSN